MNDRFDKQILQNFERKSTSELRELLAAADSGEWSDEALKIAEAILAGRPEEPEIKEPSADVIDRQGQSVFQPKPDKIAPNRSKIRVFAEDMRLALKFIVIPVGGIAILLIVVLVALLWPGTDVTTLHTARVGWLPKSAQDVSQRICTGFGAAEFVECTIPERDFLVLAEGMNWKIEPKKDFFASLRIEGLPPLREIEIVGPVDLIHRGYGFESRKSNGGGVTVLYDADCHRMIFQTSNH